MTHFGTFESGTDFDLVTTLHDQDGVVIDLSAGGSATVTLDLERRGAVYLNRAAVTNTTEASGIVTYSAADTVSNGWPSGTYDAVFHVVMGDGAVRRVRGTITMVRGATI